MSKKKKASKLQKHFRRNKPTYNALLFDLWIILIFLFIWFNSTPLSSYTQINRAIDVDEVYTCYWGSTHVHVISDSVNYTFPNTGAGTKYPGAQLEEQIHVGDHLSVTYIVTKGFLGFEHNVIIEAQNDTQVLRTQEEFGEVKGARIIVLIVFAVVEILYIAAAIFILRKVYNLPKKKKRKR